MFKPELTKKIERVRLRVRTTIQAGVNYKQGEYLQ